MGIKSRLAALCVAAGLFAGANGAAAQDCLLGEIKLFAGTYAPQGYLLAEGQKLSIQQFSALFSILGTSYGGDGNQTFGLPDLRGRVPIGAGMGPGLNNVNLGQTSGSEWTQPRQGTAQAGSNAAVGMPTQISNMQPSTGVNYIVCVAGIYPARP